MNKYIPAALCVALWLTQGACAESMPDMLNTDAVNIEAALPGEAIDPLMDTITEAEKAEAGLGERILWRGMEGADVALMQRRLYQLGYYLSDVDGAFGPGTQKALRAFQRAHNLQKIDGKAGPETLTRMFSDNALTQATPTPSPTPKPTATPKPTPTPMPTPVPTPVPDTENAPFAMAQKTFTADGETFTLLCGADGGETLYPLCGVMGKFGYDFVYDGAGSWQLERDGVQLALQTAGETGACEGAMGVRDGVVFLCDGGRRAFAYAGEAYVTGALLEAFGVNALADAQGGMVLTE